MNAPSFETPPGVQVSSEMNAGAARPLPESSDTACASLQRVMLTIVAVTVGGACLLISARTGSESGQVPWRPNSVLRIVTEFMNLNFQYPTVRGVEIKSLIYGLGASAALAALTIGWFLRTRRDELDLEPAEALTVKPARSGEWLAMNPGTAAQTALLLLACWSMLSTLWAPWTQAALGEGARQLIFTLWAIALGRGLTRKSACKAAEILFYVLAITALIGIWYYYERNPVQRLKFPIGNPIFFAACLLPGIALAPAVVAAGLKGATAGKWRIVAGAGGLLLLGWAFLLAESRGPALGLAAGGVILFCIVIPSYWQRWAIAALGVGTFVIWKLQLWPVTWLASRPETVRFRLYAWNYALNLFFSRPDVGRGQGSYPLLAQQMSRPDAEQDPVAFAGEVLGHAHNEWLQMLAELGAIGMGLFATAIGITLWAGVLAWRRGWKPSLAGAPPAARDESRWYLLGLLGGLLALLVEAATDVGLRVPGLPVIFYTVVGLLWAISKEPACEMAPARGGLTRPVRLAGFSGGLVGACLIFAVAAQDWLGALADPRIGSHAKRHQWEEALGEAQLAGEHRLSTEAYLSAFYQSVQVAHDAADHHLEQLRNLVARRNEAGKEPARVRQIAKEDALNCERYAAFCAFQGQRLLSLMPMYPFVAGFIGNAYLYREEIASLMAALGEQPATRQTQSNLLQARQWYLLEFNRDRLDPENALRLLQLMADRPLEERLNMLRVPMRGGAIHEAVGQLLPQMMQEPEFNGVMKHWLTQAQKILAANEGPEWSDAYAPESLRLAAIARSLRGEFEHAAALAGQAAVLYEQIERNFRGLVFYARKEQAYSLLLAHPDQPQDAIAAIEAGLPQFSSYANPADLAEAKRQYSLYLLADGREEKARDVIRSLRGLAAAEDSVERNIGYGLAELCRMFINYPPERRPKRFAEWLRRSLDLAPAWPASRMVATRIALEQGQNAEAVQHLEALEKLTDDPKYFASILQSLLKAFPDRAELQQFAARHIEDPNSSTRPASRENDGE